MYPAVRNSTDLIFCHEWKFFFCTIFGFQSETTLLEQLVLFTAQVVHLFCLAEVVVKLHWLPSLLRWPLGQRNLAHFGLKQSLVILFRFGCQFLFSLFSLTVGCRLLCTSVVNGKCCLPPKSLN